MLCLPVIVHTFAPCAVKTDSSKSTLSKNCAEIATCLPDSRKDLTSSTVWETLITLAFWRWRKRAANAEADSLADLVPEVSFVSIQILSNSSQERVYSTSSAGVNVSGQATLCCSGQFFRFSGRLLKATVFLDLKITRFKVSKSLSFFSHTQEPYAPFFAFIPCSFNHFSKSALVFIDVPVEQFFCLRYGFSLL